VFQRASRAKLVKYLRIYQKEKFVYWKLYININYNLSFQITFSASFISANVLNKKTCVHFELYIELSTRVGDFSFSQQF
jgi:hypothetical protein